MAEGTEKQKDQTHEHIHHPHHDMDSVEAYRSESSSTSENFSILSDQIEFLDQRVSRSSKHIVWITDQIASSFEIDGELVKIHLSDFCLLSLFMIVLVMVIHSEFNQSLYDMNVLVYNRFGKRNFSFNGLIYYLKDVSTFEHVYMYLDEIMFNGPWLELDDRRKRREQVIFGIGTLQLRQSSIPVANALLCHQLTENGCLKHQYQGNTVRIKDFNCFVDYNLEKVLNLSRCFDEFTLDREDTENMRYKLPNRDDQKDLYLQNPYFYRKPSPRIPLYKGKFAVYPPGGYIVDLPRGYFDKKNAEIKLEFLKKNAWLSRNTRAVFLVIVLYCPNTNLMSSVKLVFEVSPAGGVEPFLQVRTARIFLYVNEQDYFVLACIYFCLLFIIYIAIEEIREFYYFHYQYFTFFASYIDLSLIISYVLSLVYLLMVTVKVNGRIQEVIEVKQYTPFEDIITFKQIHSHFLLLTLFFAIIRMTRFFPRFGMFHLFAKSIKQSKSLLAWASILFLFMNFIFVHTGYLLFGSQLEDFSTFYNTSLAVMRYFMFLGDYRVLWEVYPVMGTLYFLLFVIFNFWLQGKFLLIIIYQTYLVFQTRVVAIRGTILYRLLCGLCVHMHHRRKLDKIVTNIGKPRLHLTLEDIKAVLRVFGFTKMERNVLFSLYKFDLRKTVPLSELPSLVPKIIKNQVKGIIFATLAFLMISILRFWRSVGNYDRIPSEEEKSTESTESSEIDDDDIEKTPFDSQAEYTPKFGINVLTAELDRLDTFVDTLEEQLKIFETYFFGKRRNQEEAMQKKPKRRLK